MDLAFDAILVRRLDGTILFWSRGAEQMYGWPKGDTAGKITHELLKTVYPEPQAAIEQRLLADGRWEGELVHTRSDGTTLVVASRWALRPANPTGEQEVMEINIDITAQRQISEQLSHANQQLERRVEDRTSALQKTAESLERANGDLQQQIERSKVLEDQLLQSQKMEAIGRLAGGVAHDFNNMLTVILGYNDMVMNEVRNLPKVVNCASQVQRAGERAAELTKQLLAFSRQQIRQPVIIQLNDVMADMEKAPEARDRRGY